MLQRLWAGLDSIQYLVYSAHWRLHVDCSMSAAGSTVIAHLASEMVVIKAGCMPAEDTGAVRAS